MSKLPNGLPILPLPTLWYADRDGEEIIVKDMESSGSWAVHISALYLAPEDAMISLEGMVLRHRERMNAR